MYSRHTGGVGHWSATDWLCSARIVKRLGTFDFLLRQAMQAVLTHRLLAAAEAEAEAEAGESTSLLWDLDFEVFEW